MFPLGPFVDPRYVTDVLPLAKSLGVGTVCFKTFGAGKLVGDTSGYNQPLKARPRGKLSSGGSDDAGTALPRLSVAECLHYTLTLDPDVALLGLSYPNEQDAAFAARSFVPLLVRPGRPARREHEHPARRQPPAQLRQDRCLLSQRHVPHAVPGHDQVIRLGQFPPANVGVEQPYLRVPLPCEGDHGRGRVDAVRDEAVLGQQVQAAARPTAHVQGRALALHEGNGPLDLRKTVSRDVEPPLGYPVVAGGDLFWGHASSRSTRCSPARGRRPLPVTARSLRAGHLGNAVFVASLSVPVPPRPPGASPLLSRGRTASGYGG